MSRNCVEDRAGVPARKNRQGEAGDAENHGRPAREPSQESDGASRTQERVGAAAASENAACTAGLGILQKNQGDQEKAENEVDDGNDGHHD